MSQTFSDKNRFSKGSRILTVKPYQVFAVFFHGPDSKDLEKLVQQLVDGVSRKRIIPVIAQDLVGGGPVNDAKRTNEIEQAIRKAERDFESIRKNFKTDFGADLKEYWSGQSRFGADDTETPEIIELFPSILSIEELQLFSAKTEGVDLILFEYFIVLFGDITTHTLLNLMKNKMPLIAVIHFVQCPVDEIETNFPELKTDIDFWRKSLDTKGVGVFIESVVIEPECLLEIYFNDICSQFIWYLYDIEMLRLQFIIYKTEFVEINDATTASELQVQPARVQSPRDTFDDTEIGVYLDNLFLSIGNLECENYSHLRPFLENSYGKIIVEKSNSLLASAIASNMNIESYWRIADILANSNKGKYFCQNNDQSNIQLPPYYELLSWISFAQRLNNESSLYDECCCNEYSDKCQLYILRRTLNKVIETKKKAHLVTKLCFRDFCKFVAPNLADTLRCYKEDPEEVDLEEGEEKHHNEDVGLPSQNEIESKTELQPKFIGLSFDDAFQQLEVTEQIYRFKDGSIQCSFEYWLNKERNLTIKLQLFDCSVYAYRWQSYNDPGIRILTKNSVACNVELEDPSPNPKISIQWPNGCQIRYVHLDGGQAVEQKYYCPKNNEQKRLFTQQGFVISYLDSFKIQVLTPNGTVYMLYPNDYIDTEDGDSLKNIRLPADIDITKEIAVIKSLLSYGIDCEHFDVTRSDGRKLTVLNGNIVVQKAHFLIYDWLDCNKNQWFSERDDGVKMIWTTDDFKCYYPCGTVITTTTVESLVEMSFGCLSRATQDILRRINPDLIEKANNIANVKDTYITYNMNYSMQHKNYASVAFYNEDKMVISCPDELKLILTERNLIVIDIGKELTFRMTPGDCTIVSGCTIPQDDQMSLRLNLNPHLDEIIDFENKNAFVTLRENGNLTALDKDEELNECAEEIYFVSKPQEFGLVFLPDEIYRAITTSSTDKIYFYDSPTKAVLFEPILPIDMKFSMPVTLLDKNLGKCNIVCNEIPEIRMENVLTARTIHKLETVPEDIHSFIEEYPFTEETLGDQLSEALDYFLEKKIKSKYSALWKEKIEALRKNLDFKKHRRGYYTRMLQQKVFPRYHVFTKSHGHLHLIDDSSLDCCQ